LIHLTISGDTVSKKNSKKIIYVRGRPIIIPSYAYKKWHDQAMSQLWGKKPVAGQIEAIEMILYPSTKRKFDLSNHTESLMDLLVDAGIIQDDNYEVVPELTVRFGGHDKANPRAEITIHE
jgi:Holliday junction resolvase RusA-like endonuclease